DLVLQRCDRERALPAVRLRDHHPSRRLCPVRPPMNPSMQGREVALEVLLVVLPCQSVDSRRGMFFEGKELRFEQFRADMVEQRSETLLLPFLCGLPYAFQRLGHACPTQRPVRAVLARIPLGLGPWHHRLRSGSLRFVRRLSSYYGRVRLSTPVPHPLSLLSLANARAR